MELKTNYQYTYFIYPYAIKEENYSQYIAGLIKNKKYKIKFFDSFKDIELYKYFVPNVKEMMFQDFSFNSEKISQFKKLSKGYQQKILQEQNCLMFEVILDNQIQGKIVQEDDGIFFTISKIELICFKTGICFLLLKTHLDETEKFSDILNFNYKFQNINFENKNIKKIDHIKIQTNKFNSMNEISEMIEEITGSKIESRKLNIDENLFLIYTYACLDSTYWSNENDFENIENEFIKLADGKSSNTSVNVDYDKLSTMANSSFMKLRMNYKCVALICSSADSKNYTSLAQTYENEYLYTYIIALHQKYYLKRLSNKYKNKPKKANKDLIEFTNAIWISEITANSFGQKFYKRCKEKLNLEDLYYEVKNKYDIFYKKLNIEKNRKANYIILILLTCSLVIGIANYFTWLFYLR